MYVCMYIYIQPGGYEGPVDNTRAYIYTLHTHTHYIHMHIPEGHTTSFNLKAMGVLWVTKPSKHW